MRFARNMKASLNTARASVASMGLHKLEPHTTCDYNLRDFIDHEPISLVVGP